MRLHFLALAVAFAGIAALSSADSIQGQAARARDFAAKAYLANHPEAKTLPNRVLVRFDSKIKENDKAAARAEAKGMLIRQYKIVSGLELIDSPLGADKAMEILKKNPHVISVEPDRVAHINVVPNDTRFAELWGMDQANDFDVNAPEAWNVFTGDPNFLIADFDTGIDYNHSDLANNVWTNPGEIPGNGIDDDGNGYIDDVHGYDAVNNDGDPMDDNNHGTHTAGTLGGEGNNANGVAGVNWHCKIVSIKVFNASGNGSDADILEGMQYLAQTGARVSNHSWGGGASQDGSNWPSFYAACKALGEQGHLMVCSAGNSNNNNDVINGAANVPASFDLPNIISVAALTSAGARSSFSSYGLTTCDLAAPGSGVLSSIPGNGYAFFSGTSMAAPHVTGGAALLWAYHPGLNATDIKARILGNTKPVPAMAGLCVTGGMLNLAAIIVNGTPTADAGLDQTVEATSGMTSFSLDASGSSDPDKDDLAYEWSESGSVISTDAAPSFVAGVGTHTIDLKVTDTHGASHTDTVVVTIQDTTKPTFDTIPDITVNANAAGGAIVNFTTPNAQDLVDGSVTSTASPTSGSLFPFGDTTVTVSATDTAGNTGQTTFKVHVNGYSWSGFLSPIPKSKYNMGSTIPIKFQLTGTSAGVTNLVATGTWSTVNGGIIGPDQPIGTFKYSATTHQYSLNWNTKGRPKGTYRIKANFGDGINRSVDVVLK